MTDRMKRQRLAALKEAMLQEGIDGLLVSGASNIRYLTGVDGKDMNLWVGAGQSMVLTDFRYLEVAQSLAPDFEYHEVKVGSDAGDFLAGRQEERLGLERDHLSLADYEALSAKVPAGRLIPTDDLILGLREVKDEGEIEATRRACAIGDACFDHLCGFLKPGITEREAALEIEYFMKSAGGEALSFDVICVSGTNTSRPHGIPGNRALAPGDFVTMDYGCKVDGYCSDMTRTVAIGEPDEEMKGIYELVLRAQETACRGIRAGLACQEADRLARDVIKEAGLASYFGHGLGHGTGLDIHEAPRLRPGYPGQLQVNSIVSVEPGVYLPGRFGVRIEDLVVVKEEGVDILTRSPKKLLIL